MTDHPSSPGASLRDASPADPAPARPADVLKQAADLRQAGRLDEAESLLTGLLRDGHLPMWVRIALADVARRRGQDAAALDHLRRAVPLVLRNSEAAAPLAAALADLGAGDEAEAALAGVLAADPGCVGAWTARAQLARRRGERETALAHLRHALALQPDHATVPVDVATLLRELGRPDESDEVLAAFLATHPASVPGWTGRAVNARSRGDREAALAHYRRAWSLKPGHPDLPFEVVGELRALGRTDEAREVLTALLATRPKPVRVLTTLAQIDNADGNPEAAADWAGRALEMDPRHLPAILARVHACLQVQDALAARAVLERAPADLAADPNLRFAAARVARALGEIDDALARAQALLSEVPDLPGLLPAYSQWLADAGRSADAQSLVDRLAALGWPQEATFRARLALTRFDLDGASRWAREAHARARDELPPFGMLTRVLLMRGDAQELVSLAREEYRLRRAHPSADIRRQARITSYRYFLNELAVNPPAAERVQAALREADFAVRAQALARIIEAEPGYYGPYLVLMAGLAQRGFFERCGRPAPSASSEPTIPARLMQFWDAPEPPPGIRRAMATWQSRNPEIEYCPFSRPSAAAFLLERLGPDAYRAFARVRSATHQADLFRLAWLHEEGGFYADADDVCRRSIAPLAAPGLALVGYLDDTANMGNNFIGAVAGHPVIARALEEAIANLRAAPDDCPWFATGPGLLTRHLCRHYLAEMVHPEGVVGELRLLSPDGYLAFVTRHTPQPYKRTGHWQGGPG